MGFTSKLQRLVGRKQKPLLPPPTLQDITLAANSKMVRKIWPDGTWLVSRSRTGDALRSCADMDLLVQSDLHDVFAFEETGEWAAAWDHQLNRERLMKNVDAIPKDWLPSAKVYSEWFLAQKGRSSDVQYLKYVLGRLESMKKLRP
jgi:hypothetical protein